MTGKRAPRLLDLFCKAGGAAAGYHAAGFDVLGVDILPQPHYPFEFIQADAIETLIEVMAGGKIAGHTLRWFDAVHASPPCPRYSAITRPAARPGHPDLVPVVQRLAWRLPVPYVIENVPGAPLREPLLLCGAQFGLRTTTAGRGTVWLRRHRLFESNVFLLAPGAGHEHPRLPVIGVYGHGDGGGRGWKGSFTDRQAVMRIDWMNRDELANAIPPAYTEFIGTQLRAALS